MDERYTFQGMTIGFFAGLLTGLVIDLKLRGEYTTEWNYFSVHYETVWHKPFLPQIIMTGIGATSGALLGASIPVTFTIGGSLDKYQKKRKRLEKYLMIP